MTYKRAAAQPAEKIGALAYMQRLLLKRQLRASWRHAALVADDAEGESPARVQGRRFAQSAGGINDAAAYST
ncbi:MAG TPA: hypothetical protein VIE66_17725 [Methylocella sp.]